jgi:hypothetical protein
MASVVVEAIAPVGEQVRGLARDLVRDLVNGTSSSRLIACQA